MSGLTENEIKVIGDKISQIFPIESAILFGSRAMGLARHNSDVDIAFKGKNLKSDDLLRLASLLEETTLPYQFDLILYDSITHKELLEHIAQYGKEIYRRHCAKNKWKTVSLADVCELIAGYAFKSVDFGNYDDKVIKITHITPPFVDIRNLSGVDLRKYDPIKLKKYIAQKGDYVMAMTGATIGKIGKILSGKAYINQRVLLFKTHNSVDKNYIYYAINCYNFNQFVQNHIDSDSAQPNISATTIGKYKFEIPELSIQKKIAKILCSLDDKIENNRRMNETLEGMAQALFKSWFVDFDPVLDNALAAGNPIPKEFAWRARLRKSTASNRKPLPPEIRSLFPSEFQLTEHGPIPKGWKAGVLSDFTEIKRGGSPRPIQDYLSDKGLRWLKISDVTSLYAPFIIDIKEHIKEEGLRKTVFLRAGSLVLSNSATPGIPKILDVDSCIHDGWLYFPTSRFSNEYLYLFFKDIKQKLVNLGNGSVFNNLKTNILKSYPVNFPSCHILECFDKHIRPIFLRMRDITRENNDNAKMKDLLLNKLLSGEIEI
ncbi:MAG: restriction endonuclease subunit S [Verrucomicrobia bacterium]|nr:restriction endonuclease subunit S [Verrucomicrobiota bacterium]